MYGGDEIGALVLDIGSSSVKAGYAGEDTPKAYFDSAVGVITDSQSTSMTDDVAPKPHKRYVCGSELTRRDDMIVTSIVDDGDVTDWDALTAAINHALRKHLRLIPQEHPILISEPTNMSRNDRERLVSLIFDSFGAPAIFLCKAPVLSAFSAGRSTALVVDIGASHTTVAPVHDGYVLTRAVTHSKVAGRTIDTALAALLEASDNKPIWTPQYAVHKTFTSAGAVIVNTLSFPQTHPSYHQYCIDSIIRDCKETTCRVSDTPLDMSVARIPSVSYELPDGQNIEIGFERFKATEILFQRQSALQTAAPFVATIDPAFDGVGTMVKNAVTSSDIDLHKELYSSVIVSGGTTLLNGFTQRLARDISQDIPPAYKVKILAGSTVNDRRFSNWTGGSILASLGTFHQMWLSKQEYQESGAKLVHIKCP